MFAYALAPVLTLALLMLSAWLRRDEHRPADFEPFFKETAQMIAAIPTRIGPWMGQDLEPLQADIDVLKPNAQRKIVYQDQSPTGLLRNNREVALAIVQCRRVNDMQGHYPPNCYPMVLGDKLLAEERRVWSVEGITIQGMEYRFEKTDNGRTRRRTVYNFMVIPGKGIVTDMNELVQSAEDYRKRHYGAAQVQVVFEAFVGSELTREERDDIFRTILSPLAPVVRKLKDGIAIERKSGVSL
jgi:Protein of unknown function (DUF3485)